MDHKDLKAQEEKLDLLDLKDPKALGVSLDSRDHQEHQGHLVVKDLPGHLGLLAHKEPLVFRAQGVTVGSLGLQDNRAHREVRVLEENRGHRDNLGHKELEENLD